MANVATIGNIDIDDEFEPLIIPPDASLDERLRILTVHSENYGKHLAASIAKREQRIRELEQRMNQNAQKAKEQSQKLFSSRDKQTAQPAANITSEFTTLRKEGSILATQVGSQTQGELERQEPAREEVVYETNLPIGGNQPKGLTGESQPYTEVVHGEDDPQECFSDNEIVSEQIADFSTDQAKYMATDQMHGGQDMAHDHPFDQKKQVHDHFNCDSATRHTMFCGQQVVVYNGQSVANPEDTMFYDMVVGDKADLGTSSSPKVQLKIMFRQPTKILGGQDYSSYEPNFSQVFDAKYLCFFPSSSHKGGFHAINFYASELGVKHRWPPPWPGGDLGVLGTGIPIGKLDMYVAAAGINSESLGDQAEYQATQQVILSFIM